MELIREHKLWEKFIKSYRFPANQDLSEIVENMVEKGVSIITIEIKEDAELDMQSFGSTLVSPSDPISLSDYSNCDDYGIYIDAKYNNCYVEIILKRRRMTLISENPDIIGDDLYDESKKNEKREMQYEMDHKNDRDSNKLKYQGLRL